MDMQTSLSSKVRAMLLGVVALLSRGPLSKADDALPMVPAQNVVVSTTSFASKDLHAVVYSNCTFLFHLSKEFFNEDEMSQDALRSYYVDDYVAQVCNGGFSQFVYNSHWDPKKIQYLREGLRAMKATEHLSLFEESAKILDELGADKLKKYLEGEYFGENPERDFLNDPSEKFYALMKHENLNELNGKWLRSLPNLSVLSIKQMQAEIDRRVKAMPNREARVAEALAKEPRYMKLIRALCAKAGQKLSEVTAGDPTQEYQGAQHLAWHFLTNRGHYYMLDVNGKALMFDGDTDKKIAEIDAPDSASR